ncbi:MAG TPA: tetratricopeptide repeat protein [Phycisphaerae bacterium]|nr:tetratricopeptide repeat protein [Phycisphaerae bacterium]
MKAGMRWVGIIAAVIGSIAGCQEPNGSRAHVDRTGRARTTSDKASAASTTENPILPNTHLAAGKFHESRGQLSKAAEQYQQAADLQPDSVEVLERLASALDRLGRFKESEHAYQQALKAAPEQAWLHNNLGFSYVMQRRWRDAEKSLRKAIELQPDFPRAHVNLAMALAQQEKFDEAMTHFRTVLPAEDAYFNIGLMYQSKRKLVEAAEAFKTTLELNPEMTAAREHLKALPADALSQADDRRRTQTVASPLPIQPRETRRTPEPHLPASQPAAPKIVRDAAGVSDLMHPIPRPLADPDMVVILATVDVEDSAWDPSVLLPQCLRGPCDVLSMKLLATDE